MGSGAPGSRGELGCSGVRGGARSRGRSGSTPPSIPAARVAGCVDRADPGPGAPSAGRRAHQPGREQGKGGGGGGGGGGGNGLGFMLGGLAFETNMLALPGGGASSFPLNTFLPEGDYCLQVRR